MTQTATLTPTTLENTEAEVRAAAHALAQALVETPQFQVFDQASEALGNDQAAQEAIVAYQTKQQSLQMMLMLKAVSAEDKAELARLERAFMAHPTVAAYLQAQQDLTDLFQSTAALLSDRIGLSFTAACGPGCC
jgi:cell fate (sporulation/competence/biofilm development) regulator YlbF (YheA/YmcA/DUF963 family)